MKEYWNNLTPGNRNLLKLIPIFLIFVALPLTVWVARQTQNTQQKAASVDQLEAEGGILGGNATVIADTNASGGKSVRFSLTNPTQSPLATPTPTPSSRKVINVSSIAALKTALADNTIDEIVVTNGTYVVQGATSRLANSLYIGAEYAGRTRPIVVRAQTVGGVTFSGNNMTYFCALQFDGGSHHQTWDGFKFADGTATSTGVIDIGSTNKDSLGVGAHHITLRNITFTNTLHGYVYDPLRSNLNDHAIYISEGIGGPHDLLLENLTLIPATVGPLHSLLHIYTHGFGIAGVVGAYNVIARNITVTGTNVPIVIWDPTAHDITIEDTTIANAAKIAVRYEYGNGITLRRVISTGSGVQGFYSSRGSNPPGVTFIDTNLK